MMQQHWFGPASSAEQLGADLFALAAMASIAVLCLTAAAAIWSYAQRRRGAIDEATLRARMIVFTGSALLGGALWVGYRLWWVSALIGWGFVIAGGAMADRAKRARRAREW